MTPALRTWLDKVENGCRRIERFAKLIGVNGGLTVRGWGVTQGGGPYGRTGLEQNEALELIGVAGFCCALQILAPGDERELFDEIRQIIAAAGAARALERT